MENLPGSAAEAAAQARQSDHASAAAMEARDPCGTVTLDAHQSLASDTHVVRDPCSEVLLAVLVRHVATERDRQRLGTKVESLLVRRVRPFRAQVLNSSQPLLAAQLFARGRFARVM